MSSSLDQLRRRYDALAPREKKLVAWGGAGAAVLLFFGAGVLPLYSATAKTQARIENKQSDLGWMRGVAGELRAAGPSTPGEGGQNPGQSLIVIVDQTAQQSGLGTALNGSQPSGTGGIRVRLEGANFDSLTQWLALLQQTHGVTVEAANIDKGPKPGLVNASVVLKKA